MDVGTRPLCAAHQYLYKEEVKVAGDTWGRHTYMGGNVGTTHLYEGMTHL